MYAGRFRLWRCMALKTNKHKHTLSPLFLLLFRMFDFLALEKRQHLTPVKLELFRGREWGGGGPKETERNFVESLPRWRKEIARDLVLIFFETNRWSAVVTRLRKNERKTSTRRINIDTAGKRENTNGGGGLWSMRSVSSHRYVQTRIDDRIMIELPENKSDENEIDNG